MQLLVLGADKAFALEHVYADNGDYPVTVTVTDDDDGVGTASLVVTVLNVDPVVTCPENATINEGDAFTGGGSFVDPGADEWSATVDYGDGSGAQALTLGADKAFELEHAYADNGDYTVTVTVTDDDGGVGAASLVVTALNVDPVVTCPENTTISEGDTFAGGGSFVDPGADEWTATVDYGDGSGEQSLTLGADKTFALEHTYADDGVYTVTVTVTDDDAGVSGDTLTVTVHNVLPAVDAGPDQTVYEDTTVELEAAGFTDPGVVDVHAATIDWGDGTPPEDGIVVQGAGFGSVVGSHVFPEVGVYTVVVWVADNDEPGCPVSDSLRLTVVNGFAAFGVFAQSDDVKLDDGGTVEGSVGSQDKVEAHKDSLIAGDLLSIAGKTHIHESARVLGSVNCGGDVDLDKLAVVGRDIACGDDVMLKKDSLVQGDVTAADKVDLQKGATVLGTIAEEAEYQGFPEITFVELALEAGGDDVKVKKGCTLDLEPGAYGKLDVDKDATLRLVSGCYTFSSISVDKDACIDMDLTAGSLVVDVVEDVDMKEGVTMSASYAAGGSAGDILFLVQGKHVSLGAHGTFLGTFLGPDAAIDLLDESSLTGALYGKTVHLHKRSHVMANQALNLLISLFVPEAIEP